MLLWQRPSPAARCVNIQWKNKVRPLCITGDPTPGNGANNKHAALMHSLSCFQDSHVCNLNNKSTQKRSIKEGSVSDFVPHISVLEDVHPSGWKAVFPAVQRQRNTSERESSLRFSKNKKTPRPRGLYSTVYFWELLCKGPRRSLLILLCFGSQRWKRWLQLCRGLPFFMRAALGLGMYWLLAWCSSSLLKYWMVLFKPSSRGTCPHETQHTHMRYCQWKREPRTMLNITLI